jgi:hypothetical protein
MQAAPYTNLRKQAGYNKTDKQKKWEQENK